MLRSDFKLRHRWGLVRLISPSLALHILFAPSSSWAADASPLSLQQAYPHFVSRIEGNDLVFTDGTRMPISDGAGSKAFYERLENPDIEDMFYAPYVVGKPRANPTMNSDPGRVRYEPLFLKMYGDCTNRDQVKKRLRKVVWIDGSVLEFSTVNNAADNLERVVADLKTRGGDLKEYLVPSAGTFNCRMVAGTTQRSMHGYGVAIDINVKRSNYWLWVKGAKESQKNKKDISLPYQNRIPFEIVEVFERHGFIWGGKWYHYDTMHFEYRPEFFVNITDN